VVVSAGADPVVVVVVVVEPPGVVTLAPGVVTVVDPYGGGVVIVVVVLGWSPLSVPVSAFATAQPSATKLAAINDTFLMIPLSQHLPFCRALM